MSEVKKKRKSIVGALTYAYIRKVKKWMFCPACQQGKMIINKKSTHWICEDCGYKLSADEFEDNYVASIHNHPSIVYSPPSGKNFGILLRDFEDYELVVGPNELWVLKAKGIFALLHNNG